MAVRPPGQGVKRQIHSPSSRCLDVASDGQPSYAVEVLTPSLQPPVTQINLIQNWFEELKAKVPAGGAK